MAYKEVEAEHNMWLPEKEGEQLEGEIVSETEGIYGKQFEIKKADGTNIKTPSHKVLQARFDGLTIGDRIRITFKGMEPPKTKGWKPTRIYKVEVDKPEEEAI